MDPQDISAGRRIIEYPRPVKLNGEALEEQLCAELGLPEHLVDVGVSGEVLQVGVPKGTLRSRVTAVLKAHDGERASQAWLERRGMA